jgi:hypothetical protein
MLSPDASALPTGRVLEFIKARCGLQVVELDRVGDFQPSPPELEELSYRFVGHYYVADLYDRGSASGGLAAFVEVRNGLSQRSVIASNFDPFVRVGINAVNGDDNRVKPPAQDFRMREQLK